MGLSEEPVLLTSRQVADLLAVSMRTLWRMVARGHCPQPIRYNRKLVRWRREDVERHVRGEGG